MHLTEAALGFRPTDAQDAVLNKDIYIVYTPVAPLQCMYLNQVAVKADASFRLPGARKTGP